MMHRCIRVLSCFFDFLLSRRRGRRKSRPDSFALARALPALRSLTLGFTPRKQYATAIMLCGACQELRRAAKSATDEVRFRENARRDYLERRDCQWDGEERSFLEQAVAEAEIRSTEARSALVRHVANCLACADFNAN